MTSTPLSDVIDAVVPLAPDQPVWALRRQRDKVVAATQGSYDAMFSPAVEVLTVKERLLVALHACRVSKAGSLAAHYRERLMAEGADEAVVAAVDAGHGVADARLQAMLAFTTKLIERPIEGDRAAVQALAASGLSTPAIVAMSQLIAFLSYQVRVAAGLKALAAAAEVQA
ncbi:uncharacterized protein YciW [Variovorax sp. TBS-050B]|uniref:CMD domain-containing protein n=1 Tax=Variovorax sp. TBS-050B TaxID=2940551 RepID=UPI002476804D|nr:CMD domain protein [Variovorax sp. TBS-050B]MDH6592453.1 uncharacterized protein YciW [Variovorax sp. TBS-050B]